jgi:hypothetical protein
METTITNNLQQQRAALQTEIGTIFQAWNDALSAFSQDQFNRAPFEGSWTPGQVAEHILKSVSGLPDRRTERTRRPYDEKVATIGDLFLNFTIKMQSPDFVRPGQFPQDKMEVLEIFSRKKTRLEQIAASTDLTLTCLDFEFPTLGMLTRYEWIKFFLFHIQRHTWQLTNILAAMNGK